MPKQFRSPQQKKDLSYKKDHRTPTEDTQVAGKTWSNKKAYTNRSYRHKVDQLLHTVEIGIADEDLQNLPADAVPVRRAPLGKPGPATLRSAIKGSLRGRAKAKLASYMRNPYNSETHKEIFTRFLHAELKHRTALSRELAMLLEVMLKSRKNPPRAIRQNKYSYLSGTHPDSARIYYEADTNSRAWLQAYLKDTPEMEAALRGWIKEIMAAKEILL